MPKVSVIMPAFNSEKYIAEAIESTLEQTFEDYEVIIVDDGSNDNTQEICKQYLNKYQNKVFYVYQDNQGPAAARNTAIRQAKGEYIALLDSDDKWFPERLQLGIDVMEQNKEVGLVHANIVRISEKGELIGVPQRNKNLLSGKIYKNILLRREHISCPTILFRRECCEKVGFFDESRECIGVEDRDLCLRILQKYEANYINRELSYYRVRKTSVSQNNYKMINARLYVVNKIFKNKKRGLHLKNKAIASIYSNWANELFVQGDYEASRREYLRAMRYEPLSFLIWLNYVKTFLKMRKNYAW